MSKDADLQSFHSMLLRLHGGAVNEMLSDLTKKCVQEISDACLDRGGKHKATLTLKLDFVMDQKDRVVEIFPSVDEKFPKTPLGRGGMFFCDAEGNLCRENPRQATFDDELERQRRQREAAQAEKTA